MPEHTLTPSPLNRKYGWKPSLPDHRDHMFGATIIPSNLPPSVDLRSNCPPVYDQGATSSCVGNSVVGAMFYDHLKEGIDASSPSRLFLYYQARSFDGTTDQDCGSTLRDGIAAGYKFGAPDETVWPFDPEKVTTKPSPEAYTEALTHRITSYQCLNQDLNSLKSALAQGSPFVFGFTVYAEFESPYCNQTGILLMPQATSQCFGGHAVCAVGYNDSCSLADGCPPQHFIIRNSWGADWGADGYFFMPFAMILNGSLANDFWAVKTVS